MRLPQMWLIACVWIAGGARGEPDEGRVVFESGRFRVSCVGSAAACENVDGAALGAEAERTWTAVARFAERVKMAMPQLSTDGADGR